MDEKSPTRGKKKNTPPPEPPADSRTIQDSSIACPNCKTENRAENRFCAECATPLRPSDSRTVRITGLDLARGDVFASRYEIIEPLGQGGMGKVFKAYDRQISEVVAVKLIKPEISMAEGAIVRFKNELKIARKITHRNVCRMHDIGAEGMLHYITMEYVAGEDLKRFIRRAGMLSPGRALHIARQVCEGLAEAHHLGIVHRDLKPQNIMIDSEGNAKIMDFGIARFAALDRMTGSGVMIGTPEYMSPEQADLKDVDARADIYALGIVLYEMLAGRMPFEGETPLSVVLKHKTEKAKDVRTFNPQVEPELAAAVAKCMEKDPAARFQTTDALGAELARLETSLATGERIAPAKKESGPTRQITVPVPTKKFLLPAVAVLGLAVVLFVVFKVLPSKTPAAGPAGLAGAPADAAAVKGDAAGAKPGAEAAKPEANTAAAPAGSDLPAGAPPSGGKTAPVPTPPVKPAEGKDVKPASADAPPAAKPEVKTPAEPAKPGNPSADRDSVSLATARTAAARALALKSGVSDKDLFIRVADSAIQEAQRLSGLGSYAVAKSLLSVAEKAFRVIQDRSKDDDRLAGLKKLLDGLRADVEAQKAFNVGDRDYVAAQDIERKAAAYHTAKEVEKAARTYLQAAAAYDRILRTLQAVKK
jgi:hypothetical protein